MARKLGVGVIGCGNISAAYLRLAPLFKGIEMRACADIDTKAAKARAKEFNAARRTNRRAAAGEGYRHRRQPDDTGRPLRRVTAGARRRQARLFGKAVRALAQGRLDLKKRAEKKGLRIGSAPDTFLGGAHQLARHLIDSGQLGKITSGTCHVMSHGMEHWHPNPDFFFQPGAGPVLDVGPYYVSDLIQLIGPVKRVGALSGTPARSARLRRNRVSARRSR